MPVTLAQLAKMETLPLRKGILMNIIRFAKVFETLPFESVNSLKSVATRIRTFPASGAFRRINAGYTEDTSGDLEQVWEAVYAFGGDMQFDRVLDKIGNYIVDPKTQLVSMKTQAMSYTFNDYFINGDHATDPDGFEGLRKRVSLYPARQTIWAANNGAVGLDPTASIANARQFLDRWNQAWYRCNGGSVNAIFLNELLYYGFAQVMRYAGNSGNAGVGFLDVTKDSFERTVVTYMGAPFVDMGMLSDQTTEIITNTEAGGTGVANTTSAYFVSYGVEQGITGIQLSPMEVYDPMMNGEMETLPSKMTRIEWWMGLAGFGSYGITRFRNLEGPNNWT